MTALVIGLGSALRGDDAAGLHVAEGIHAMGLPGVQARSVHQLTPELALDLADVSLVVFVDADVHATEVTSRTVSPAAAVPRTTHHLPPDGLLALAAALEVQVPPAVAVGVPARDLGLSTALSPSTARFVHDAVRQVADLLAAVPTAGPVADLPSAS